MGAGVLLAVSASSRVDTPAGRGGSARNRATDALAHVLSADPQNSPHAADWSSSESTQPVASSQCSGSEGCWPAIYILGAQKAMTTSIFDTLEHCGLVCAANFNQTRRTWGYNDGSIYTNGKEAHFFDVWQTKRWDEARQDPSLYTRLYQEADCPSRRFTDATPNYIANYDAPARMELLVPQAWQPQQRFVVVLREPTRRDLSWFNHRAADNSMNYFCSDLSAAWSRAGGYDASSEERAREAYGNEAGCSLAVFTSCLADVQGAGHQGPPKVNLIQPGGSVAFPQRRLSPAEADLYRAWAGCKKSSHAGKNEAVSYGIYAMQLRRWRQFVPRKQLLVLQHEAFEKEPDTQFAALGSFLGLPPGSATAPELRHDNVYSGLSKPRCATVEKLASFFRPYNEILQRDLDADRSSGAAPPQELPFAPWPDGTDCFEGV